MFINKILGPTICYWISKATTILKYEDCSYRDFTIILDKLQKTLH